MVLDVSVIYSKQSCLENQQWQTSQLKVTISVLRRHQVDMTKIYCNALLQRKYEYVKQAKTVFTLNKLLG